jgi:hypothetical protein
LPNVSSHKPNAQAEFEVLAPTVAKLWERAYARLEAMDDIDGTWRILSFVIRPDEIGYSAKVRAEVERGPIRRVKPDAFGVAKFKKETE